MASLISSASVPMAPGGSAMPPAGSIAEVLAAHLTPRSHDALGDAGAVGDDDDADHVNRVVRRRGSAPAEYPTRRTRAPAGGPAAAGYGVYYSSQSKVRVTAFFQYL
jgi:hypothetical protein